ncbi:pertactin-like passenger domain-containing protein [Escherichia coli]
MNTDIASYTGDKLNITGDANGNFVLNIKNTGQDLYPRVTHYQWFIPVEEMLYLQ